MDQRFCTSCGERLEEPALFCTNCGQPRSVKSSDTVPVPVQKPAPATKDPAPSGEEIPRAPKDQPSSQRVLIGALVVGALLLGGGIVYALTGRDTPVEPSADSGNSATSEPAPTDQSPTDLMQPSPNSPAPKDTPSDLEIATSTIKGYTTAINQSDQSAACTINSVDDCAALWAGAKDSVWSDVHITGVTRTGKNSLTVYFTGKTTQPPGSGPAGHSSETCTRWELGYRLKKLGTDWHIVGGSPGASDYRC